MTVPILTGSDLNDKKIRTMVYREYINGNPFRWAMGKDANAIIQLEQDTKKGAGDTIIFSFVDAFDTTKVKRGNDQLEGNEVDLTYRTDSVTVDYVRYAGKVEQAKLVRARTPVQVVDLLRPQIIDAQTQILRDELIDAAAASLITPAAAGGTAIASASSPNRSRSLFGASDANWNTDFATAIATLDSTNDQLTMAMCTIARNKALNVSAYSAGVSSRKMRPFKMKDANNAIVETYVMFLDPISAAHLQADSGFKDLRDDNRSNQLSTPYFDGSKFLGMAGGILFYVIEELIRIGDTDGGDSTDRVAHNLLCGAQAWGVGVAEPGFFSDRKMDYDMHVGVGHTIIRKVKMLMFDSVENGIVHVFCNGEV